MKPAIVKIGVIVLMVACVLISSAWFLGRQVDRATMTRWLHQWQHDGTSLSIELAEVIETWQGKQRSRTTEGRAQFVGREVEVSSVSGLLKAINTALPGDRISVAPGEYLFSGRSIEVVRSGTATRPIILTAEHPWQTTFSFNLLEGLSVTASDWHFDGLSIEGVCSQDSRCEHAFHIVGKAYRTRISNSRIVNFNAPIKINGDSGHFPDGGLIENTYIGNTRARDTTKPVVGIDAVAVNHWLVRNNLIANFKKTKGNHTSSGGFFKGAGGYNRFESNLVVCSERVAMEYIQIGLSLGNGGTSSSACRDGRCQFEQRDSDITGNLIANCSDVGIYLNRASGSTLTNNTLYSTLGIDVRFEASNAIIANNLLSGRIKERDGGEVVLSNHNWTLPVDHLWRESFSDIFRAPERLNFSLIDSRVERLDSFKNNQLARDICGAPSNLEKGFIGAFNPVGSGDCLAVTQ